VGGGQPHNEKSKCSEDAGAHGSTFVEIYINFIDVFHLFPDHLLLLVEVKETALRKV